MRRVQLQLDQRALEPVYEVLGTLIIDPGGWAAVSERLAGACNAECVSILHASGAHSDVTMMAISPGSEDFSDRYFKGEWHRRDFRTLAIPKMRRTGSAVDQDIIASEQMDREPYYQELLAPVGLRWWTGLGFQVGDKMWCAAVHRSPFAGAFLPEEQAVLERVRLKMGEAAALAHIVGDAALKASLNAVDLVGHGAVILDQTGLVIDHNERASHLFDNEFRIRGRRLFAKDALAMDALSEVQRQCASSGPGGMPSREFVIRRKENLNLVVRTYGLSGPAAEPFKGGKAIVTVKEAIRPIVVSPAVVQAAFELTPAETRLTLLLSKGIDLEDCCHQLSIKKETGRTMLKSIFRKAQVNRQSELVLKLSSLSRP